MVVVVLLDPRHTCTVIGPLPTTTMAIRTRAIVAAVAVVVAASQTVTLAALSPLGSGATTFNVSWSGVPSPVSTDWISLYCGGKCRHRIGSAGVLGCETRAASPTAPTAGTPWSNVGSAFLAWAYVTASPVGYGGGSGWATLSQVNPSCPSQSIVAWLVRDPSPYTLVATSNAIPWANASSYGAPSATPAATPNYQPPVLTLTAMGSLGAGTSTFNVSWSGVASPASTDWISLYCGGAWCCGQ